MKVPSKLWADLRHGTAAMDAALAECPQEIRDAIAADNANLRGSAPKLLGRDLMVTKIQNRVTEVTNAKEGEQTLKATALAAPPGAGKTAIIDALEEQLRKDGVNVIQLKADDLISPAAFSAAMRRSPPWNRKDFWRRLGKATVTGVAVTVDDIIGLLTTLGLKFILKGIGDADAGPIQAALEAWRDHRIPDMNDVLILMRAASKKGVAILIDEAQELVQYEKGTPEHTSVSSVLKLINDPSVRTKNRLWNVTFVAAGMQDTAAIIHRFTTVPPEPLPLEPVDAVTARAMIEERIQASQADGVKAADRTAAIAAWAEPLTERYGDWTRHARCAGEAARIVLKHAKARALTESWGVPLLIDTADGFRTVLYTEIIDRANQNQVKLSTQFTVIEALARNERNLSEDALDTLVSVCLKHLAKEKGEQLGGKELAEDTERNVRNMKRSGLINLKDGQYVAPIPSMIQFMTENRQVELERILPRIEEAGLQTAEPPE